MNTEAIKERYTDTFFRRVTSRLFFVWLVCTGIYCAQLIWLSADKMQYAIHGKHYIALCCFFVAFNFIQKCVDSWKADAVIKLVEAVKK